jgi:heparan-alpha-glucosaminide N-acetyltransferase
MKKRMASIDITRGIVVAMGTFLGSSGGYQLSGGHAAWYGLTIADFVFPAFLTLYGVSMALAYDKQINWPRMLRRTALFIVLGLLFNMAVTWNTDFSTLRFTGVLQLYAAVGLLMVLLMSISRKWWVAFLLAVCLLFSYGVLLKTTSVHCPGGIPQPGCNLSAVVDGAVFGKHQYAQGQLGHDPEGLVVLIGALANALLGFAAGRLLIGGREKNKNAFLPLFALSLVLFALTPLLAGMIPIAKRLWTPSFAALTAGAAIFVLAANHFIADHLNHQNPVTWVMEAFGRNSFILFFGAFVFNAMMIYSTIAGETVARNLLRWLAGGVINPLLSYAIIITLFWTIVAAWLHRRKWYVRP